MAIINEIENGGLKIPHLEFIFTSQRISCLKRFSKEYHSSWKYILKFFLKKEGGVFVLCCNFDPKLLCIKSIPPFYNKCLSDFARYRNFLQYDWRSFTAAYLEQCICLKEWKIHFRPKPIQSWLSSLSRHNFRGR